MGRTTDRYGTRATAGVRCPGPVGSMDEATAIATALLPAEVRETHSGVVVLVGDRACKVKKPVDLGFLDFTTEAARRRACRRELVLNRRLAPDVYLDLVALRGSDGRVVEHGVLMRRMPDDLRLSTLMATGADVGDHLQAIARQMAAFHTTAKRGPRIAQEGRARALRRRWEANLDETVEFRGRVLEEAVHDEIGARALGYVDGRAPLLADRAAAGLVVDGHGDLIAEDVFCLPDHPRILDCLEFDDRLRYVDVLDDVAFLAMDLERLGRPELAERLLGWYAEFSGTPQPPSLAHHYIAYRAYVRAKVACIRAAQGAGTSNQEARDLADLALSHLRAGEVSLVLVGGAPGTGKTTLAAALADRVGAVLLSSDSVRRELPLPPGSDPYSDGAKTATYRELLRRGRLALQHGETVVADATWGAPAMRAAASEVARATSSRLVQLECRLPRSVAAARAQRRLETHAAMSDAGAEVALRLATHRVPWPDATAIDTHERQPALDAAVRALAPLPDARVLTP